jgi:hypothetical protein
MRIHPRNKVSSDQTLTEFNPATIKSNSEQTVVVHGI